MVSKTYTFTVEFEKETVGQKGDVPERTHGSEATSYEIAPLSESDLGFKTLRDFVLKRIQNVCPVSQGNVSAHLSDAGVVES